MDRNVIYYEELDSTNNKVKELAAEAAEGLVVVAKKQTKGRGRRGRSWESNDRENLYMSLLLKPNLVPDKAPMLTLVMAYSVSVALQRWKIDAQIKWPNDLVLNAKKICGILTEMEVQPGKEIQIVVGVGINVGQELFPVELQDTATSIFLETGKHIDREELLSEVLDRFEEAYKKFLGCGNLCFLQKEYNDLLVSENKVVRVLDPKGEYEGTARGIDESGALLVEKEDGTRQRVFAGEVSVRGIYGYV